MWIRMKATELFRIPGANRRASMQFIKGVRYSTRRTFAEAMIAKGVAEECEPPAPAKKAGV